MPNANRTKGLAWERKAVHTMRVKGFVKAARTRDGYHDDKGDVEGVKGLVIQCKDWKTMSWTAWFEDLAVQVANAEADHGVLVVKRRGIAGAERGLAVMEFDKWLDLAKQAGYK